MSAPRRSAIATRRESPAAYVCRTRKIEQRCNATILQVADVDARVWTKLVELIRTPELLEQALAHTRELGAEALDWQADADGYRQRIAQLDRSEAALLERFTRGRIGDKALDVELDRISADRDRLRAQLQHAGDAALRAGAGATRLEDAKAMLAAIEPALDDAPAELRRELAQRLLRGVTFRGREIQFVVAVPRAARASAGGAAPRIALVRGSGWDVEHESDVQIRMVA